MEFWRMYRRLVGANMRGQMQYRVAFLLDLVGTGIGTAAAFGTLALILQRFENIAGWTLAEIALLYGLVETAFGLMDMIFSGFDPGTFGQQVRRGTFDQMLLRPLGLTLQVFGSDFALRRLARIFQGAAVLGYALIAAGIRWTLLKVLFIPVVLASLVCFFGALFIVGATITFWTVESIEVVNIFTYGGVEMMSYPMEVYHPWLRRFFTFIIPGIFVNYYPALYLLDRPDPLHMPAFAPLLAPVVGGGMLLAALAFWNFGIRYYQSTG
ncbi:MAG TPA: ABC-2 family transporter protein, partial [Anaerolineae bacterium]|nr:ABC-2 family transporter protein [Anaerolineae bacterium]